MSSILEYSESDKSKLSLLQAQKQSLQKSWRSHHHIYTAGHILQVNIIFKTSEATKGLLEATLVLQGHSETFDKLAEVVIKRKTEPKQLYVIDT